jgi:hypothetical protein
MREPGGRERKGGTEGEGKEGEMERRRERRSEGISD